jgi:hypothetical protein
MIDGTRNLMHRTLLMVLYATGVRRTELSLLMCLANSKLGLIFEVSAAVTQAQLPCLRSLLWRPRSSR